MADEWFTEMGMEDALNIMLEDFTPQPLSTAFGEDRQSCHSSESSSSYPTTVSSHSSSIDITTSRTSVIDRPAKQLKPTPNWNFVPTQNDFTLEPTFSPNMLSFANSKLQHYNNGRSVGFVKPKHQDVCQAYISFGSDVRVSQITDAKQNFLPKTTDKENKRTSPLRRPPCPQDDIIAERKRRERLTGQFIALSALIPDLTKMDKASVLGDSIKYMKQLQERVRTLEEQTSNKGIESTIFVKKFQVAADSNLSSIDEDCTSFSDKPLSEIQVRVSKKNVLIKIHCEIQKGVLVKALTEIEKLNLSIVSSSVIPFGASTMDITVMTQMDEEFIMPVKELVKNLRSAFVKFM